MRNPLQMFLGLQLFGIFWSWKGHLAFECNPLLSEGIRIEVSPTDGFAISTQSHPVKGNPQLRLETGSIIKLMSGTKSQDHALNSSQADLLLRPIHKNLVNEQSALN